MNTAVRTIFIAAQQLSPDEQWELLGELSESLRRRYPTSDGEQGRTSPVTDLSTLAADFWPADETADDINAFVARQRAEDLHNPR